MAQNAELGELAKVVVVFERRPDGGLRVYSDDVPGFVLSHSDGHAAFADVRPALEGIISEMVGFAVRVSPLRGIRDVIERKVYTEPNGGREIREYVTVPLQAA